MISNIVRPASLRSACAYAQSDQSLCLLLEYSRKVKLLTEHHLEFLSLKGGCTGSFESSLVKMPQCWKSPFTSHMIDWGSKGSNLQLLVYKVTGLSTTLMLFTTLHPAVQEIWCMQSFGVCLAVYAQHYYFIKRFA